MASEFTMTDTKPPRYPREWEQVSSGCWRLQVPGGWMVEKSGRTPSTALVFFPDPDYAWVLRAAPKKI